MMNRQNISSGTRWEAAVGYSRAVRIGPQVWVAGTTAVDAAGAVIGEGDAYAQAAFIFQKIERALTEAGATLNDVVRTRMYLTRLEDEQAVGRAHAEVFSAIRPAATMIAIAGLVDPRLLVEIEVEACVTAA
jgi:enamine deaminase RidA (YjgF/YER057c/UK114 family)